MKAYPLYIDGEWHRSGNTIDVTNPANGEVIAQVSVVARSVVSHAISCAQGAFFNWSELCATERGAYLHKIADALERKRDEIAKIITLENGKPIAQSHGEISMSIDHLRWFAEEAKRVYGRIVPQQAKGKRHLVLKSPIGVVGAISPWNFPLVLAVRKIAPALAAGCPVILKPASQTPLCAIKFAECVEEASLPRNVFQVVLGNSSEIGGEFLRNSLCKKISFTGSTEVGQSLIKGAAEEVTALSLELGGNAPLIVFEDADIEVAVRETLIAKFRNSSQSCIAANRIYVHAPIYEAFVSRFVDEAGKLKVGNGLEEDTELGPLINAESLSNALAYIEDAVGRGAKLLRGGKAVENTDGWFLEPTVLGNVTAGARCIHEEVFAPIAPIIRFERETEAISMANASPFGLSAYVFTSNLARALRAAEQIEAGTIGINDGAPTVSQCPFGGFKKSGWGRELGMEGIDAYLETKHVSISGI